VSTSSEHFDLPVPSHVRLRRRKYWIIVGIVVALVLASGGWVGKRYLDGWRTNSAQRCPGLNGTSGDGFALSKKDEQCIGWIIERDYPFGSTDQKVVSVISKITEENRRVRDQPGNTPWKPYVRIGVLMPMTSKEGSTMNAGEILHALQGAYTAQMQANDSSAPELGDTTPLIQLVLANEGLEQSLWPSIVDQLGLLKDGDHPLVAVTGLGVSDFTTRAAAERLSALGIPTIGAVIKADDMVAPWLFKMSPPNQQNALALRAFLEMQQKEKAKTGYLIYDRNDDPFVRQLKDAFTKTFDSTYGLTEHSAGFNGSKPPSEGAPVLFSEIVSDICLLKPDVVFYAGRSQDLPVLVRALKGRGHCQNPVRPLVVITARTGPTIARDVLNDAQLGLLNASNVDSDAWRTGATGAPRFYGAFHNRFTEAEDKGGLGFAEEDLTDGYAVMHRDAVVAAIWAARRDAAAKAEYNRVNQGTSSPISELPTARDVHNFLFSNMGDPIPGASGAVYFKEQPPNDLWPSGKPVPIIRIGALVANWPSPDTYITQ